MKAMKFLAVMAAAAAILACKKETPTTNPGDNQNPGGNNQEEEYSEVLNISPYEVTFEGEGGTVKVVVTTSAEDYTVTGAADWLTVAKNGKELSLTAAANTVNAERKCELTIKGKALTSTLPVTQKAGSPYPGYTVATSVKLEYGGTMLYTFMKPTEEDYGGWATMEILDEDGNKVIVWMYTDLFTSAEEVELTPGTYVKGADDYLNGKLCAKKLTYMPGLSVTGAEEDDNYTTGTFFVSATEQAIPLVDGTLEVSKEGEGYLVKLDMTDAQGTAYKYVFTGDVVIDTQSATYPSGKIDVANTVFAAVCYYKGSVLDNGTTQMALQLYSGSEENYAITNFDFNIPVVDFAEDLDLSGTYSIPETEEQMGMPGTLDLGVMVDYGFFQYPSGTFIQYAFGDYLLADAYAMLQLTKQEDGKYTVLASLMSQENDMVMFIGSDFTGIHDLEIPVQDARQGGEED